MMKGASPKGRRSAPPKLAKAPRRASTGTARSVFRFSARWRSSRDCCAASRWIWWPGKRMSRSPGWPIGAIARLQARLPALTERERDDRDDEIARLKSKVGEISMDIKARDVRATYRPSPGAHSLGPGVERDLHFSRGQE